jgi:hypothetical protein
LNLWVFAKHLVFTRLADLWSQSSLHLREIHWIELHKGVLRLSVVVCSMLCKDLVRLTCCVFFEQELLEVIVVELHLVVCLIVHGVELLHALMADSVLINQTLLLKLCDLLLAQFLHVCGALR